MTNILQGLEGRHPSIAHFADKFSFDHLPDDLAEVSQVFHAAAQKLADILGDGPELAVAFRKLREAKDCAVLQKHDDRVTASGSPVPNDVAATQPADEAGEAGETSPPAQP